MLSPSKLITELECPVLSTFFPLMRRGRSKVSELAFSSVSSWSPFLGNIYWILSFRSQVHTHSVNVFSPHNWRKVGLCLTCRAHCSHYYPPSALHTGHADLCQSVCLFTVTLVLWLPPPSVSQGPLAADLQLSSSFATVSKSYPTVDQHVQIPLT